ncbi:MAG: sugar phosphate isomerase/epimerase family protein [Candidatus Micrarchaeia archaeon]
MNTFLKASYEAGFRHVELDLSKLFEYLTKDNVTKLVRTISEMELEIVSLNAIENIPLYTENELKVAIKFVKSIISLCDVINCKILVVNPNEITNNDCKAILKKQTIKFLKIITKIAEKYEIKIGFEFVSFKNRVINNLEDTINVVNQVDFENFCIVADVFHLYRTGVPFASLKKIPRDKLWIIHVNDVQQKSLDLLMDKDRVFPGEGLLSFFELKRILNEINFDKYVSVELFNERYWNEDPYKVAKMAKDSLKILL